MRRVVLFLLACALAGCGGGGRGHGTATLWVTRDRGAHVIFAGTVAAGDNGIRTVARRLKITTRYGGRYLQSVRGLEGSLAEQRDWFYFLNGVEGDVSAAEVRVRPGDVLWWDFRRWTPSTMHIPVVAGAYPQPFFRGRTSVVSIRHTLAARIAKQVRGVVNSPAPVRNYIIVGEAFAPDHVHIADFRKGVVLELGTAIARRLAADPTALRFRFGT